MERIDIKVSEIMKYDRLNSLKWFIHFHLRVKKLLSSCIVCYFGLDSISFSTGLKDLNSGLTFPFHKWINRYLRQRSPKKIPWKQWFIWIVRKIQLTDKKNAKNVFYGWWTRMLSKEPYRMNSSINLRKHCFREFAQMRYQQIKFYEVE